MEYKIPLEAETRTDQLECQSLDENNANESTETLVSRYEIQQFVWLLSMPLTAEVKNAMQDLTEVDCTTSEQHKDMSDLRIKWDMKGTKTILKFMEARDPFSEDSTLSIVTGVIADNRVNVDKAEEVGQNILKTMTHKNTAGYTLKKDKQAITMDTYMIPEVIHKQIQVDPRLLFQRLIAVKNYTNQDVDVLFKHELCAVPASLFESNGLPRKANKPVLAEAIWKVINANVEYLCQLIVWYVLDGGSLLQRLPWKRGSKFSSIYDSYISYVIKKYNKAVVVFDGCEHGPAPKDVTHHRRTGLSEGIELKF